MRELRCRMGFVNMPSHIIDSIEQCLLPCERQRLRDWQMAHQHKLVPGKPYLVDVMQNVGWSASGVDMLPTLTRNMIMLDLQNKNRLMTSAEMFLSQGHPVMKQGPGAAVLGLPDQHSGLAWQECFDQLSRRERLAVLGNGQHIVATGCFVLWCLANLVHIDDLDYDFNFVGEHRAASAPEISDSDGDDVL